MVEPQLLRTISYEDNQNPFAIVMSPKDPHLLASGHNFGLVHLWDIQTGDKIATLIGNPTDISEEKLKKRVKTITFSPDGKFLVGGDIADTIRFWKIPSEPIQEAYQEYRDAHDKGTTILWGVTSLAFNPDGNLLVSGGNDAMVRFWDIEAPVDTTHGKELEDQRIDFDIYWRDQTPQISLSISHDGELLVMSCSVLPESIYWFYDFQDNKILKKTLQFPAEHIKLAFNPKRKLLAAVSDSFGRIFLQDVSTQPFGKCWELYDPEVKNSKGESKAHVKHVWSACFSPDGKIFASAGGDDESVKLWDTETRELIAIFGTPLTLKDIYRRDLHERDTISHLTFSCDGRHLVTSSISGTKVLSLSQV